MLEIMYLHLIHPDKKFVGPIVDLFETALPEQNIYVEYALGRKSVGDHPAVQVVRSVKSIRALINTRKEWSGLIVNGLAEDLEPALEVIPSDLKVAWFLWGYELYDLWPSLYRLNYGSQTRRWEASAWKHHLRPLVWHLKGRYSRFMRVLRRMDFFVSQLPEEYVLLQRLGLACGMRYVDCPVVALDQLVDLSVERHPLGPDIQVGNSASYTNNFAEIFEQLTELDLSGRKVVVPLSYGSVDCREKVLRAGERLLGKHFEPVLDFMPLAEYNRLLGRCGTIIMNHHRQQAVGNIVAGLWRGARVYLNDTTVYRSYRELGIELGRIDTSLTPSNLQVFDPLDAANQDKNRRILRQNLSREAVVMKARRLLDLLRA